MSRGKKNWQKLRNIILSKNLGHKQKGNKFELFKRETKVQQNILYTTYHFEHWELIQAAPLPLYKQLLHFKSEIDATGKWVWEAEEIAAYFLIKQGHKYLEQTYKMSQEGKRKPKVLELGAGCSGLASIAYTRLYEKKYKE